MHHRACRGRTEVCSDTASAVGPDDSIAFPSATICRAPDFEKRGVKLIGISANGLEDHERWVKDINDYGSKFGPTDVQYPIVSLLPSHSCG